MNCPSCGAAIEFAIGSSAVRICPYCRAAVARTGDALENLGVAAELIATGSPLRAGMAGRYQDIGFRLTGRAQLRHESGAVWDEWYAAFDDGRWGWLEESDGEYYVTFETADSDAPPASSLQLGEIVPAVDGMKVFELATATVVSGEGEIPWRATPGAAYRYADLSGVGGRFATIEDLDGRAVVFKGRETSLAGLGLESAAPRAVKAAAARLSCTQCGGVLDVLAPNVAERVACQHCGALHQIESGTTLAFVAAQEAYRGRPAIPLGTKGTIDGAEYVVAGFLRQEASSGGEAWSWDEYLLFNREEGFRYLTSEAGHWSFEQPLLAGEIRDDAPNGAAPYVHYNGRRFRLFETATPRVAFVIGEFPWRVEVGESVHAADYIAPPFALSKEIYEKGSSRETNYSVARYMKTGEVEAAFGVSGLEGPRAPGALQPNPYPNLFREWAIAIAALLVVAILLSLFVPRRVVHKETFEVGGQKELATQPFRLDANRHIAIRGYGGIELGQQLVVDGELARAEEDVSEVFDLWMGYESGHDDEGPWTEDERKSVAYLAAVPAGEYSIELLTQTNAAAGTLAIEVQQGVFRWSHLLIAAVALSLLPLLVGAMWVSFETKRWQDSDYSPYGSSDDDDDED